MVYFIKSNINSYSTFKNNFLPSILNLLKDEIEYNLQSASTICLIVDIWTDNRGVDFISLSASLMNIHYEKSL
jgi:hypothetical protein